MGQGTQQPLYMEHAAHPISVHSLDTLGPRDTGPLYMPPQPPWWLRGQTGAGQARPLCHHRDQPHLAPGWAEGEAPGPPSCLNTPGSLAPINQILLLFKAQQSGSTPSQWEPLFSTSLHPLLDRKLLVGRGWATLLIRESACLGMLARGRRAGSGGEEEDTRWNLPEHWLSSTGAWVS